MELTFVKKGEWYEADFTADKDFNLHIEKSSGTLYLQQSSVQGAKPAAVRGANWGPDVDVIDEGFSALVYPMYIRVKSSVEPSVAAVAFS